MKRLLLAASMLATPAIAAPSFSVSDVRVAENGGSATVTITKSGKASSYSKLTLATGSAADTAKPGSDYQAVNLAVTIGNNELAKTVTIPIINDAIVEPEEAFTVRITGNRNALIARGTALVTIADDDAQTPPPSALTGEAAIADNFQGGLELTNGGARGIGAIPPDAGPDDTGAFRMICLAGQLLKDDPIQYPGQPGASHLHQYVGNTGTNANSNYQNLRTTGATTCGDPSTPLNRSAYWIPAMLNGVGGVVKPDFLNLYYKRIPASAPGCTDPVKKRGICVDLPNGIRYIFGYNMKTGLDGITDPNSSAYWLMTFTCQSSEDGSVVAPTHLAHTLKEIADAGCPVGAQIIIVGFAEDCWDGVHLDTPDHRSHMAYATGWDNGYGRTCDAAHPYLIPDMQFQWHFTADANLKTWHLASDEMVPGVAAGTTLHMDYWEAWSPPVKQAWQQSCINGHLTCASGDLGNGTSIKGAGAPVGGFVTHAVVPVP